MTERRIPRLSRLVGGLWKGAGLVLLALLVLEGLLRVALPEPGSRDEAADGGSFAQARSAERREADAYAGSDWIGDYWDEYHDSGTMRWVPYVYFRREPCQGRFIRVDERGLRHSWNPPEADDQPRVWLFGGSVLWGTGSRDDYTIPSFVSRRLAEAGRPCQVTNFGETGWVSTQGLVMLLRELQAGRLPDVVVFFDGVNDVARARQGFTDGSPGNEFNRVQEFNLSKDSGRLTRALLGKVFKGFDRLSQLLRGGYAGGAAEPGPARAAARDRPDIDVLAADTVRSYARALALAVDLGRAGGFDVLAYSQPDIAGRRSPSEYERRVIAAINADDQAWQAGFEAALAQSADIAALPGFRSLIHALDELPQPVFLDFAHISEAGNAAIADEIVADLLPLLERRAGQAAGQR